MKYLFFLFSFFLLPVNIQASEQCSTSQECGDDQYCEMSSCSATTGQCTRIPDFCLPMVQEVCGCDGISYVNDCERKKVGIAKSHEGMCQNTCENDDDCSEGYFCQLDGCNGMGGSCIAKPEMCTSEYRPVCACNGKTYANDCERKMAGISRQYIGECPKSCVKSQDCQKGEYCQKEGCLNDVGVCTNVPEVCPNDYAPVCGCDSITYENDCKRKNALVGKLSDNKCDSKEPIGIPEIVPFSDTIGHIYQPAIEYVYKEKIVNGFPDGTYRPNQAIDRAQLVKIVMVAVYGDHLVGGNCFPDVTDQWFAPYVCSAKSRQIINGYADGLFRPGNAVSYAEALKIAINAHHISLLRVPDKQWYWPFIGYAFENKLSLSTYRQPHQLISRAEMAEIIFWISELSQKK